MKPLVNHLGNKEFLVCNNLTMIDFHMLELCEFTQWVTYQQFYKENENVERYIHTMKTIPAIERYLYSGR